ncbi:biotin transporter BioY [Phormidium tenue FACHB-886]|nr:biotin transporter BioY [Phormidium tenue FACHB-886]
MALPTQLLWAIIGLILTIGATLLEAFIISPWGLVSGGAPAYSLGVTCQFGAALLVGCLGGSNAAVISQIAYLVLGLSSWFNVFTHGGGLDYVYRPTFGYLLGFVPGAWVCGWLAFRFPVRLEHLALSCLCGLITIHLAGIGYLWLAQHLQWMGLGQGSLIQAIVTYSLSPLLGQLAIVCAVAVLAFLLRRLMFY